MVENEGDRMETKVTGRETSLPVGVFDRDEKEPQSHSQISVHL